MRRVILLLAVPLILVACDRRHTQETTTTVTKDGVTTTTTVTKKRIGRDDADERGLSGLDIDTDKFKANIEIPAMIFGGDDMDLDGMKLYPGSKVKGIRVKATEHDGDGKGTVTMDFTSPAAPATVADHMMAQARKGGFTVSGASPAGFAGTKVEDKKTNSFTVALNADGDATRGQLVMTGSKEKSGW